MTETRDDAALAGSAATLRDLREARGLSMLDAARAVHDALRSLGFDPMGKPNAAIIYQWEHSRAIPLPKYQRALAIAYGFGDNPTVVQAAALASKAANAGAGTSVGKRQKWAQKPKADQG